MTYRVRDSFGVRRAAVVAGVAVAALAISGCGVPSTRGAEPLPSDVAAIAQPPDAEPTTSGSESVAPPIMNPAVVAFVHNNKLVPTTRVVEGRSRQEILNAALDGVIVGPDDSERAAGLITLLRPDASLSGVLSRHAAVVSVDFGQSPGGDPALAVGQVALTALGVPGVLKVLFLVDGSVVKVPMPGDRPDQRAVTARDYRNVIQRSG